MRRSARKRAARRVLSNIREGRLQRSLALVTAASALPLGVEIWFEHYRGSFGDKWMWTPIVLTPPLVAAGVGGAVSPRIARTALPAVSLLYAADGIAGVVTHIRGVMRKPGGFREPIYNIVMGPPLLAPGSLVLVGAAGLLAAASRRER
jgi:hypothetical protein